MFRNNVDGNRNMYVTRSTDGRTLESITARGVRPTVDGALVEIGSARLWNERQIPIPVSVLQSVGRLQARGRSVMIVKHGPT